MGSVKRMKVQFVVLSAFICFFSIFVSSYTVLLWIRPSYALDSTNYGECLNMSSSLLNKIESGEVKVTYECFGAKGDGDLSGKVSVSKMTNDMAAIRKAHEFANNEYIKKGILLTVYATAGKTYYIGATDNGYTDSFYDEKWSRWENSPKFSIPIITNVDWQGANFIIDDYVDNDKDGKNDVNWRTYLFRVISPLEYSTKIFENGKANPDDTSEKWSTVSSIHYEKDSEAIKKLPSILASSQNNVQSNTANLSKFVEYVKNDASLSPITQKYLKDADKWMVLVNNDNVSQYIRQSANARDPKAQTDTFVIDSSSGKVLSPIDWDYDTVTSVSVWVIPNEKTTIKNGNFTTWTNNEVYTDGKSYSEKGIWTKYTQRNIAIQNTGNVEVSGVNHLLDESKHLSKNSGQKVKNGNTYGGFIRIDWSGYVTIRNCRISAHTPSYGYNKTNGTQTGTYDLGLRESVNVTLDKVTYPCSKYLSDGKTLDWNTCYSDNLLDPEKWGIMGTNGSRNVFITSSKLNRVDAHRGMTNLYIDDSIIGVKGLTMIGKGNLYVKDTQFDRANSMISLRYDYGSTWDGTILMENNTWKLPQNTKGHNVIYSSNSGNPSEYFGYRTYFPSIYIKGLTIDTSKTGKKTGNDFNFFRLYEGVQKPKDSKSAYYFKGNLYIDDVSYKTGSGKAGIFTSSFANTKNKGDLVLSNYGGTNKVNIYWSKNSFIVPAINSTSSNNLKSSSINTKFGLYANSNVTSNINTVQNTMTKFFDSLMSNGKTVASVGSSTSIAAKNIELSNNNRLNETFVSSNTKYTASVNQKNVTVSISLPDNVIGVYSNNASIKMNGRRSVATFKANLNYGNNTYVFYLVNLWGKRKQYQLTITRNYSFDVDNSGYVYDSSNQTLYTGTDKTLQVIVKKLNLAKKNLTGKISQNVLIIYDSKKKELVRVNLAYVSSPYLLKKDESGNQNVSFRSGRIVPSLMNESDGSDTISYNQFLDTLSVSGVTVGRIDIPEDWQTKSSNIYDFYKIHVVLNGRIVDTFSLDSNLINVDDFDFIQDGNYMVIKSGMTVSMLHSKFPGGDNIRVVSSSGDVKTSDDLLKTSDSIYFGSTQLHVLILGDMDGNGIVDMNDIHLIRSLSLSNENDFRTYIADVTSDGEIAINDIDKIDCFIHQKITDLGGK